MYIVHMLAGYLIFFLIWLLLTAFGTFMGYGLFPNAPIFTTGAIACLVAWVLAIIVAILRSVTKDEINTQKLSSGTADYSAYPGDVANHTVGETDIGGRLIFFPESLVFHPLPSDPPQQDWIIPYKDIADVRQGHGVNKINIESKNNTVDSFAIHNKDKWIHQIKKKAGIKEQPALPPPKKSQT